MTGKKEELAGIVGETNVLDEPETLEAYSQDQSFSLPIKPRFVVKPKNAEEVQGVVKWANETSTPLVPVSSGPPHFNGDTVPSVPEAVIVALSGMKRIIGIDRRNRSAQIEPGVTYPQLQQELAKEGLMIPTPLLPRANKSVVASLLERQPTLIPKYLWTTLEPLRGVQVTWGNGDTLPPGGGQVDFNRIVAAAQGSMGIAIMGMVRCQILPKIHKLFFVPSSRLDNLIDFLYGVLRFRFGDQLLILNSWSLASILGSGADQIEALMEKLPPWVVLVGIGGRDTLPEESVDFQEKDISDIAQKFGLSLVPAIPGARKGQMQEAILNPSKEPYWKLGHKGGCQDIFFITTLDKTPEFVKVMYSLAEQYKYPISDIGVYIQPVHQGASCHCEFSLPYDPNNSAEVVKMKELFTKASEELLRQGAFYSRPYGIWANMAYNRDAQATIVLKKIKEIFDPNYVMNPGKLCF